MQFLTLIPLANVALFIGLFTSGADNPIYSASATTVNSATPYFIPRLDSPITGELRPLNIQVMLRGSFYASTQLEDETTLGLGGWGGSDNRARPNSSQKLTHSNTLILWVDTASIIAHRYDSAVASYPVYLVNSTTKDTFRFAAQDSRLSMKLQAKIGGGIWRDIEYLPSSWCGNSYHTVLLGPGYHWAFTVPLMKGSNPAQFRIKLDATTGSYHNEAEEQQNLNSYNAPELFSNSWTGSLNLAQFENRGEYRRGGLMDPYNE